MEANNINDINDEELKNRLANIKEQIEDELKNSNDRLNQKMKLAFKEIKNQINKYRFSNIKDFREHPIIRIKYGPEANFNYIINPILLILANLKVITEFTYSRKTEKILKRINEIDKDNIIQYFINLMSWMRDNKELDPNFRQIHQYFKNPKSNAAYLCQDPGYWFNLILSQLEYNIDLVKSNDIENIITNNFAFILCEIEECPLCPHKNKIKKEKKLIIDLSLESNFNCIDELNDDFNNLYFGEKIKDPLRSCPKCTSNLTISKAFYKTGKYMIINLYRKNDMMKLEFFKNLKIKENSKEKEYEYEYELISALAGININLNYTQNMGKSVIFVKNFISGDYFEIVEGNPTKIVKFKEETSKQNPNILIYKKK